MNARPGEAHHRKGADGAERACDWLDATTRTSATWINDDDVIAGRLSFEWPNAPDPKSAPFSFDIGGILWGDEFHNHQFVAEVKNYSVVGSIGEEFDDFLAKCYHVAATSRRVADQFMFITWNPFRATNWAQLTTITQIKDACLLPRNRGRLLGETDVVKAEALLSMEVLEYVEERLWLLVLSEKQEKLMISEGDHEIINKLRTRKRKPS